MRTSVARNTPGTGFKLQVRNVGNSKTLVHQLINWAETTPHNPAIHGRITVGEWKTWSWSEYWAEARLLARGLQSLGHEVGECVAIVGNNRPEWSLCQFAIMANRGIPAPIYTTLTSEQVAYIVQHSQARIAICDTSEQLDKYLAGLASGETPRVEHIVTMDDLGSDDPRVITYDALKARGAEHEEAELETRLAELTEDETCLLIYTSGTTGTPKAVQLEHGGILSVARGCMDRFSVLREPGRYRTVSYLPLCHVAEQLFTTFFHLDCGGEVYYCPDLKQLKDYLVEVRPTSFVGVPRVWEKFQAALEAKLSTATGIKARLVNWSLATELAAFKKEVETGQPQGGLSRWLANKMLVKVKTALGLENVVVAGTGAAPIGVDTLEFFASLGIIVYEGYGMSETSGLATLGDFGNPRFGTVGTALAGVTIKIADDDEILLKGRNMTRGYLRQDDKTAELLDEEGWLHTGDLGSMDEDGFLRITGRKKDLLITAGGKNVAPAEMEGYMKSIPGIGQAVVVGDRMPYLSALILLDVELLEEVAKRSGAALGDLAQMSTDPKVHDWAMGEIQTRCNARVASYQTIKKIRILPVEFTVESGEVTPTMKIKRNVVSERYKDEIAAFYA